MFESFQNHSVQHFVYTLGKPKDKEYLERLGQIADQNNLKLNKSSGIAPKPWPKVNFTFSSLPDCIIQSYNLSCGFRLCSSF